MVSRPSLGALAAHALGGRLRLPRPCLWWAGRSSGHVGCGAGCARERGVSRSAWLPIRVAAPAAPRAAFYAAPFFVLTEQN